MKLRPAPFGERASRVSDATWTCDLRPATVRGLAAAYGVTAMFVRPLPPVTVLLLWTVVRQSVL